MKLIDRLLGRKSEAKDSSVDPQQLFLAEVEAEARRDPELREVKRVAGAFALSLTVAGSDVATTLYLDNAFAETRELSPQGRAEVIGRYLQLARHEAEPLAWDEVRSLLVPVLRSAFLVPKPFEPWPFVSRDVLPCLRELVVIDAAQSMAYVSRQDQAHWRQTDEALFAVAYDNFAAAARAGVEQYEAQPSPIWTVATRDDYESSRLLCPRFLASFADKVEGRPIAIVPERSMLFVAGDARPETVMRLCDLAEREYGASSRSVSCGVYTVDESDRVVPYRREGDDPVAARVRRAHRLFAGTEYSRQKSELDALLEKAGADVFVASFSGYTTRAGREVSFCTWAYGVDSLLPETDAVVVGLEPGDESPHAVVRWEDALRIVGPCLARDPGMFPPRWRTAAQPTKEQLAELARNDIGIG